MEFLFKQEAEDDVRPHHQSLYFGKAGLLGYMNLRLLRYARNDESDAVSIVIARVVAVGIGGATQSNLAIL
jgi:hypothetical protein